MPDIPRIPRHSSAGLPAPAVEEPVPDDLAEIAQTTSLEARRFLTTVTEVAAGANRTTGTSLLLTCPLLP